MTAAQRALMIPETLEAVLLWIDRDTTGYWYEHGQPQIYYQREGVLARCGLVNRCWYKQATRLLWKHPAPKFRHHRQNSLPALFDNIDSERRQFYADFIENGVLVTVSSSDASHVDEALRGLRFPKLESLSMYIEGGFYGYHIPRVEHPQLSALEIDPPYDVSTDTFGVPIDDMDEILEQVPVSSPSNTKLIV